MIRTEKRKGTSICPKKLYVNGEFVDAFGGGTFETEDPALGACITAVPAA